MEKVCYYVLALDETGEADEVLETFGGFDLKGAIEYWADTYNTDNTTLSVDVDL